MIVRASLAAIILLGLGTGCSSPKASSSGAAPVAKEAPAGSTPPAAKTTKPVPASTSEKAVPASTSEKAVPASTSEKADPATSASEKPESFVEIKPSGARVFANCAEMNEVYPHGVGREGSSDQVTGKVKPVTNFERDDAVYAANKGRDRDGDGVACEKA